MKKITLFLFFILFISTQAFSKEDSLVVHLVKVYPEPFHDFLKFEFAVSDTSHHIVSIKISDNEMAYCFLKKFRYTLGMKPLL